MGLINTASQPRLEAWLAEQAGARRVRIEEVRQPGGGAISTNLALALAVEGGPFAGRHDLVLRADPAARLPASLTKPREFAALKAACAAGVRAPEPLFSCPDRAVLGREFYLMRRAQGVAAGRLIVKNEEPQRELAREMGRQLARLHSLQPGAAGLDTFPVPQPSAALAALRLYREWLGEAGERDAVLAWGLRWLELNAPPAGEVALCHRDYRTGNYLVQDGRLTAILDWEFAGWSDPMEDIAWFCARSWRFGRHDREAGGIAGRADFYAGYEDESGRKVDEAAIAYWETSAYMRWAAIAWRQALRHISGAEASLELALTGRMLPEIGMDMIIHLKSL